MTRSLAGMAVALLALASCAPPPPVERELALFGGNARVEVWATTERSAVELVAAIERAFERADATFDPARPDSEIRRLNEQAGAGAYRVREQDLYRCVRLALDYARATAGSFDPTVGPLTRLYANRRPPAADALERALGAVGWSGVVAEREALAFRFLRPAMELDLGGIAPGYALDIAARSFALPGSRAGLLRFGGHAYVWGRRPDGEAWRVPLPDPRASGRLLGHVEVGTRGIAVAASEQAGDARPDRPIVDPRSGLPARSDVRVAVALADSGADADAMSTALVVGGSLAAGQLLSETHRVEALLLVEQPGQDAYLLASASLRGAFRPDAELAAEVGGRIRFLLPPQALERPGRSGARRNPLLDGGG